MHVGEDFIFSRNNVLRDVIRNDERSSMRIPNIEDKITGKLNNIEHGISYTTYCNHGYGSEHMVWELFVIEVCE